MCPYFLIDVDNRRHCTLVLKQIEEAAENLPMVPRMYVEMGGTPNQMIQRRNKRLYKLKTCTNVKDDGAFEWYLSPDTYPFYLEEL